MNRNFRSASFPAGIAGGCSRALLASLAGATLLALCLGASAADKDGRFAVRGAGFATCEHYIRAHQLKANEWYVFYGWLDGYLSAISEKTDGVFDVAPWQSTELIAEVLRNACSQDSTQYFLPVMRGVTQEFGKFILANAEERMSVEVGKQNALVYPSTVKNVQQVLSDRGYYKGDVTGQFTPDTQAALVAFQTRHGIPVNGIPGPVTLWALLVEELP